VKKPTPLTNRQLLKRASDAKATIPKATYEVAAPVR
jgi:hypothetical protein